MVTRDLIEEHLKEIKMVDKDLAIAKEDYCQQLERQFDNIKFVGISVSGQEVEKSTRLSRSFVMPDVVDNAYKRSISAQEIFKVATPFKKVVLLGAPGSGKTTLMSYFAVSLAQEQPALLGLNAETDWLPILISIRDLARYPDISLIDYARQYAEKKLHVSSLPAGFFEHWLEDGRALILLDGLDEVVETSKRNKVAERIESFLNQFDENRAIITSRSAAYRRDFFHAEKYLYYELQEFDDDKIQEFVSHWYDSHVSDVDEAKRRKDSLRKALSENDRIQQLAQNPLLLTLIALTYRDANSLSKQRHKLYDKAVETLLISWDAEKEISPHTVLKHLETDDLRRLMQILAHWIHSQENTKEKEEATSIGQDYLIEKLSKEIQTLKQVEPYEAEAEAQRFVNFIQDRTGLLSKQGQDCYAFTHKVFQEYLCAQHIDYLHKNKGNFEIIDSCINSYNSHPCDSHWREVLLLLIFLQEDEVRFLPLLEKPKNDERL